MSARSPEPAKGLGFLILMFFFPPFAFADMFPVEFIPLGPDLVIHRSYEMVSGYRTPSNGLLFLTGTSVVLVDTAWNNEETAQILRYVKRTIGKPVSGCIITHFHQDRSGGVGELVRNNIPVYMTGQTYRLMDPGTLPFPYRTLSDGILTLDGLDLEIRYPGPAHSPDNIIVYIPRNSALFGGCLVKSHDSKTIGNTADADLAVWPAVIRKIKERYSDTRIVIPGHGDHGGPGLLDHTLELLK